MSEQNFAHRNSAQLTHDINLINDMVASFQKYAQLTNIGRLKLTDAKHNFTQRTVNKDAT